jgi:hypothetical protein
MRILDVQKSKEEFKEEMKKKYNEFKGHVNRVKLSMKLSVK